MSTDPNRIYLRLSAEDRRAIAKRERADKTHINDILRPYAIAWGRGEEPIHTGEEMDGALSLLREAIQKDMGADLRQARAKREEVERENHHLREAVAALKDEVLGRDMKVAKAERHGHRMQTAAAILAAILVIGSAVITAIAMHEPEPAAVEVCPPCPDPIPCPVWERDAQPPYERRVRGIVDVWMDSTGAWRAFDDGREITVKAWQP
jgi:hypothetical protein